MSSGVAKRNHNRGQMHYFVKRANELERALVEAVRLKKDPKIIQEGEKQLAKAKALANNYAILCKHPVQPFPDVRSPANG